MSQEWRAVLRMSVTMILFAGLVFLPAGTWRYWEGWVYLAVWFLPGLCFFAYFARHDKELVRRRMLNKEGVKEQRTIMAMMYAIILVGFVIPGLDFRFGWTRQWAGGVPLWLIVLGLAMVLAGSFLSFWVMYVNRYAARVVQVEAGQKVISSGPYALVRHPMYSGIALMMVFTPLALASYVALPVFLLTVPVLALRLRNEEGLLRKELPGYAEYCEHTRHRLIPYLW
jgi:protein-S-isoprenylcysteine O-methyltransferase Ste14